MILFSSGKRRARATAAQIYAACVTASRAPDLFVGFGVPDTLQGRFELLSLHLFPVLYRLMHDPGDDPELARLVAEAFVSDMDAAMRETGVSDTRVPKRMKSLYASFAGRINAYKTAFGGGQGALAAAVERNVFPDGAANGRAAELALYLEAAVAALRNAPLEALRRGELPFPRLAGAAGEEIRP